MSKTRGLTGAQIDRRRAILARLETWGAQTADMLRGYLAQYRCTFVTVDTVQRDLREMEAAGTVKQGGHTGGRSNRVIWRMA